MTDDFPAAGIENGQMAEAIGDANIANIGHPDHIRPRRDEIAAEVRIDR